MLAEIKVKNLQYDVRVCPDRGWLERRMRSNDTDRSDELLEVTGMGNKK